MDEPSAAVGIEPGFVGPQRILLIHRWFWPDTPPYASMLRSIGRRLVAEGHEVTVLTAQPSYSDASRNAKCPRVEGLDGMTVHRVRLLPETKRNYFARGLNMLLFMFAVRRFILKRRGDHAFQRVMVSTMPPVLVAATVRRATRRRGGSFIYHMMDIYPEIAWVSGIAKRNRFTRWLAKVDRRNCREAERVVVLSEDMKASLQERGLSADNVTVLNNFRLEDFEGGVGESSKAGDREEGYTVLFAGNIGRFQGLEDVVEAMHLLADREPRIRLELLGSGHGRRALEELAGPLLGKTIHFRDHLPFQEAVQVIRRADLSLVTLQPEIIRYAYPSKTMTCLAEGSPLLAMVEEDSELARMVRDEGVGYVTPQKDPEALSRALESAFQQRSRIPGMRDCAKALAEREYLAEAVLPRWTTLFSV